MTETAPNRQVLVVRLSGDVTTKSTPVRRRFIKRVAANIAWALGAHGIAHRIENIQARILVYSDDPEATEVVSRVFGVHEVGRALNFDWATKDEIIATGARLFAERVAGSTFAVRARRVGRRNSNIPFRSIDVERELGAALFDISAGVNLTKPEVTARVDILKRTASYYVDEPLAGPGGLPLGVDTRNRALMLISGGFDSAVAAWYLLRRSVDLDFVFFNLAGPPQVRQVSAVLRRLVERWCYGVEPTLTTVDLRPAVARLKEVVPGKYWQVVLKRLMMRAAALQAAKGPYGALVTGEAIGQVSTQTLGNMVPIANSIGLQVLRPLVGFNKEEIIARSRLIGTHDLSSGVPEFCALDGGKPVTHMRTQTLDRLEEAVGLDLVADLVERAETSAVRELEEGKQYEGMEVSVVPEGATIFDLRSAESYETWHYPGAVHLAFEVAMETYPGFSNDCAYLFYCDAGLKSAYLAEKMRDLGFEAHVARGGVRRLRTS